MPDALRAVLVRKTGRVVTPVDFEEGVLDEWRGDEVGGEEVVDEGGVGGAAAAPGHGEGAFAWEEVDEVVETSVIAGSKRGRLGPGRWGFHKVVTRSSDARCDDDVGSS